MNAPTIPLPPALCSVAILILGSLLTFTMGCGSKAVTKALDKAKQQIQTTTQAATETIQQSARPNASSFEFRIEGVKEPLLVKTGRAEFAAIEKRPLVVNFMNTSGRDASSTYPTFLVSVHANVATLAEMVGKSHPARIFLHVKQAQAMYCTTRDRPAQVTIEAGDEFYVTAKFDKAELFDSTGQESIMLNGKLTGLIPQPPKPKDDKKATTAKAEGK